GTGPVGRLGGPALVAHLPDVELRAGALVELLGGAAEVHELVVDVGDLVPGADAAAAVVGAGAGVAGCERGHHGPSPGTIRSAAAAASGVQMVSPYSWSSTPRRSLSMSS